MTKNKNLVFYLLVITVFATLMFWLSQLGKDLEVAGASATSQESTTGSFYLFQESFLHGLLNPLAILLLQIISIIVVARAFGFIFNKIGQPTVIGEIIAGIVLGPSVVGAFFPEVSGFLFPVESLGNLQFLSQVGLILFMFVIGMELDLKILRNKANHAILISHTSIIVSYFLGMVLAYFLYRDFANPQTSFISFGLFIGISLSITAFPVLARIIQERDLTQSRLGILAITSAASDDITAWCALAAVVAVVKAGSAMSALYSIALALIYVLTMLLVIRPFLQKLGTIYSERETISKNIVAIALMVLLISAYAAEVIGIHPLFGAFLAGVIMPPNFNFRRTMTEKFEDVSVVLLLPLFFVFTGLRTQIGLLNDIELWKVCGLVIITAVLGKFGVGTLTSRFLGNTWKDSLSIGALMNTRGLMELIVLNIGYDLGVLSPKVFAMFVLMALVTTFMTGPALDLINYLARDKEATPTPAGGLYRILISFGPAIKGKKLLRLADQLTHQSNKGDITALHLTPSADINPKEAKAYEEESFRLVKHEAETLGVKIRTIYRATNDINNEIISLTNKGHYDLLLVGASHSVFSEDVVGGKVKTFLEESSTHVGVLVDRDFEIADRIMVTLLDANDLFLISFAERFIRNNKAKVTIIDPNSLLRTNTIFKMAVDKINHDAPEKIQVVEIHELTNTFLNTFNLVMVSYSGWKEVSRSRAKWLIHTPSALILKAKPSRG